MIRLLQEWKSGATGFRDYPKPAKILTSHNLVVVTEITPLVLKIARLIASGWSFDDKGVRVTQTFTQAADETSYDYAVGDTAQFYYGEQVMLAVNLAGRGELLAEAVCSVKLSVGDLFWVFPPMSSGKGQQARCLEIARSLYAEHGYLLAAGSRINIPYETRGGKCGRLAKVACRSYDPADW